MADKITRGPNQGILELEQLLKDEQAVTLEQVYIPDLATRSMGEEAAAILAKSYLKLNELIEDLDLGKRKLPQCLSSMDQLLFQFEVTKHYDDIHIDQELKEKVKGYFFEINNKIDARNHPRTEETKKKRDTFYRVKNENVAEYSKDKVIKEFNKLDYLSDSRISNTKRNKLFIESIDAFRKFSYSPKLSKQAWEIAVQNRVSIEAFYRAKKVESDYFWKLNNQKILLNNNQNIRNLSNAIHYIQGNFQK